MNKLVPIAEVKFSCVLHLGEDEIMALDGIFGYSVDAFLKEFYRVMGRAYVEPYEEGVRTLHESVRAQLGPIATEIKRARKVLADAGIRTAVKMHAKRPVKPILRVRPSPAHPSEE